MDKEALRKMVENIVADTVWMIRDEYFVYEYEPSLEYTTASSKYVRVDIEHQDRATIDEGYIVDEIMGNLED